MAVYGCVLCTHVGLELELARDLYGDDSLSSEVYVLMTVYVVMTVYMVMIVWIESFYS